MKKITATILYLIFFITHSNSQAMDTDSKDGALTFAHAQDLFAAIKNGDLATVRKSLDAGANVDYQDPTSGITPLMQAVCTDNLEMVQLLLAHRADPKKLVHFTGTNGSSAYWTALHSVADKGYTTIAKYLLEKDRDIIDLPDPSNGITSLMQATYAGHLKMVQLLLAHGADPKKLAHFTVNGRPAYPTALHFAAFRGNTTIAKCLLEKNRDIIDLPDSLDGFTSLMEAVCMERLEMVQLLLAHGANHKLRDKIPGKDGLPRKWTALCNAAHKKNALIAAELAAKVTLDRQDKCPVCFETGEKITPGQLRITACCMKPVCYDCAQAIRTSASGNQCPLCRTQPLLTVMPPEQEPEKPLHVHV